MPVVKPPALVEKPLDGQEQYAELNVTYPYTVFRVGQIVKESGGVATPISGTETTGFYLVVEDNETFLPQGSSKSLGLGFFVGGIPRDKVRTIPVSGKRLVMTLVNPPANPVGGTFGLTNVGDVTAVDGSNTTPAFSIEKVVERLTDGTVVVLGKLN